MGRSFVPSSKNANESAIDDLAKGADCQNFRPTGDTTTTKNKMLYDHMRTNVKAKDIERTLYAKSSSMLFEIEDNHERRCVRACVRVYVRTYVTYCAW